MNKKTSLASQLKALETPQTNLLKDTKVRPSFLYQRHEANAIDRDTHFTLCLQGFKQICSINPSFKQFEETLFNASSKNLDRGLLTKDASQKLDKIIKDFLFKVLSPYFMLSATHKMLEWLIYQYSVHTFNSNDLLLAVLPYHETKLFPRVVKLVSSVRDPSDKWHWLVDVHKHEVPLPKSSLLNHCRSHQSTLQSLIDSILEVVKDKSNISLVISFFTSIVISMMEFDFDDEFISIIIYYLLKAFRSSNDSMLASGFMILAHMSTRVTLNPSKLDKLMTKMAKYSVKSPSFSRFEKDFLLTLVVVYEFQETEEMDKSVASVINVDLVLEMLEKFQSKHFLGLLLGNLIEKCEDDEIFVKVMSIIDNLQLSSWVILKSLGSISKKFSSDCPEQVKERLMNTTRKLEKRFPVEFDQAINKVDLPSQAENFVLSSFYTNLEGEIINVFNGLVHSTKRIRLMSAMHIAKNFKKILNCDNQLLCEKISHALTDSWIESDPAILIELLSCKELFLKMVPLINLLDFGKRLLPRCVEMIEKEEKHQNKEAANDWRTVERYCFNLLFDLDYQDNIQFWNFFVDYFLPLEETDLSMFSIIFNTTIKDPKKNYLSELKTIFTPKLQLAMEGKDFGASINLISSKIAELIVENPKLALFDVLKESGSGGFRRCVLSLCVLYHALYKTDSYESFNVFSLKVIEILEKLLEISKIKTASVEVTSIEDCINNNLKKLRRKNCPTDMVSLFLSQAISSAIFPSTEDSWYWSKEDIKGNFFLMLLNFLASHCQDKHPDAFRQLMFKFLDKMGLKKGSILAGLWTRFDNHLYQYRSLSIATYAMKDQHIDEIQLISLLLSLLSVHSSVRAAGCKFLQSVKSKSPIVALILGNTEFIENSHLVIAQLVEQFFLNNEKGSPKKDKTDLRKALISHIQDQNTPPNVRVGLMRLLSEVHTMDCLNLFIKQSEQLIDRTDLSPVEQEVLSLTGIKMMNLLPKLTSFSDLKNFEKTFSYLLNSEKNRVAVLSLVNSAYIKEFETDFGKTFLIRALLNVLIVQADKITKRKLKKLLIDGKVVSFAIDQLTGLSDDHLDEETEKLSKKRKLERKPISLTNLEWRKVILMLEILGSRDRLSHCNDLMASAFDLLKESLMSEEAASFEYLRLLLLITISLCLDQEEVDLNEFEIQYIFETLRAARLPETQMQALQVILKVSSPFKDEILHNLMSIFGFIGSSMIKYDDQYAHKILDNTMDTIISNFREHDSNYQQIIEMFTDSLNDIPAHRRLYLFHKLSSLLDEKKCLWFVVFRLIQRIVYDGSQKKLLSEFIRALVCTFEGSTQLITIIQLLKMLHSVLNDGCIKFFGSIIRCVVSERKSLLPETAEVVLMLVSCDDFVGSIAESKWSDIEQLFKELLESNLLLLDHCVKNEFKTKGSSYKAMLQSLLKILEKVNNLLPGPEFVSVLHRLLGSPAAIVKRKAMELFNSRLTSANHEKFEITLLRGFVSPILSIVQKVAENTGDQQIINSQTGLMSLKLLAKQLKNDVESQEHLKSVLDSIVSLGNSESCTSPNLLASVILCIAQLVATLQNECFGAIPSVMSIILSNLSASSEILTIACLISINKITKSFASFLNPYLKDILFKLCTLSEKGLKSLQFRIMVVQENIATHVPLRILLTAVETAYEELTSTDSLYILLSILAQSFTHSNKADIETNLPQIQKISIHLLDYRYLKTEKIPKEQIDHVEEKSLNVVSGFVPKLSEQTFRSFFYKIYDWAILCKEGSQQLRLITFYRLTNDLADKLKSLFCAFAAPYIVNNCAQQLKAFHIHPDESSGSNKKILFDEEIGHLVLINILGTLSKCFLHDINASFSTKDRVSKLVDPIIDQISNDFGTTEQYLSRINLGVVECIKHLSKAVSDHNIVKDLNYKILLRTRENNPKIRGQALHVVHQMMLSMSEEYLPLLPEAIPFLAELHEDDAEEIQKSLALVISDIERIFGEPISSYF